MRVENNVTSSSKGQVERYKLELDHLSPRSGGEAIYGADYVLASDYDALALAARNLLLMHDDFVFACGDDDELSVANALGALRLALRAGDGQ